MANYTEHYQLHQWEGSDPFLRTDFNEDFQKIDTAIAERGDCLICNGKYVGTGTSRKEHPNTIITGFKPSFVTISGDGLHVTFIREDTRAVAFAENAQERQTVIWEDQGVSWHTYSATGDPKEQLNEEGVTYHYVALG